MGNQVLLCTYKKTAADFSDTVSSPKQPVLICYALLAVNRRTPKSEKTPVANNHILNGMGTGEYTNVTSIYGSKT